MLHLTRRFDESVLIGDNIRIVVLEIRGNHVKIGIEAPREIAIMRGELVEPRQAREPACPTLSRLKSA